MLSNLDDQRAVWSQIRAFHGGGSRGRRAEGNPSQDHPWVTKAKGESYLEPAAGQDQEPGAVGVAATSDQSAAPLHPGKGERSCPGTRRVASAESGTWAVAPGVLPGAAPGGLEPRGGRTCWEGPSCAEEGGSQQQGRREPLHRHGWRQSPAEKLSRRTRLRWRSRWARGGGFSAGEAEGRERAPGGHTLGLREKLAERLHAGERPALQPPAHTGERRELGRHGRAHRCGRKRGRKTRRATAQPPDRPGNGSCLRWACGASCMWEPPWCTKGTA